MDKNLQTYGRLIRLVRGKIDQHQILLTQIESRRIRIEHDLKMMDAHLAAEESIAETFIEAARSFPLYAQKVRESRGKLERQQREIMVQLDTEQGKMLELFTELKTYEIARDKREMEIRSEFTRTEQIVLDDICLALPIEK